MSSAQHSGNTVTSSLVKPCIESEVRANAAAITELSAHVSAFTKNLEKFLSKSDNMQNCSLMAVSTVQSHRTQRNGKCQECQQQGYDSCNHCFRCGQTGHRAVGCLNRSRSGNGSRSRERDGL